MLMVKPSECISVVIMHCAIVFLSFIHKMLFKYTKYTMQNLTEKEYVSRMEACTTYRLIDDNKRNLALS
jgi:hypothetical protein